MIKCSGYDRFSAMCLACDIKSNIICCKEFDFDKPLKYVTVKRNDMVNCSWNECPTCTKTIGYFPKEENFRCPRCNQRISW